MRRIGTKSVQGKPSTSTEIVPICVFLGLFLVRIPYAYLDMPSIQGIYGCLMLCSGGQCKRCECSGLNPRYCKGHTRGFKAGSVDNTESVASMVSSNGANDPEMFQGGTPRGLLLYFHFQGEV